MSTYTQIHLHLAAWAHHPSHARFHMAGIARALNESGITGFTVTLAWITLWTLALLNL